MLKDGTFKEKVQYLYREHPLYSHYELDLPNNIGELRPEVLVLDCVLCKTERPFKPFFPFWKPVRPVPLGYESSGSGGQLQKHESDPVPDFYHFQYTCTYCGCLYYYAFRVDKEKKTVTKVGQYPPPAERIDPTVQQELGFIDAALLRKGLRNLNYGYGIGACAYMRRLVEDQIVSILRLMKEQTQDEERLAQIEEALQSKDFTRKTQVAKDFAPDSLRVGDMNVLKIIHDEYSKGMHGYSDEQCLETARKLRTALEFALVELKAHEKKRKAFIEAMKEVEKGRTKQ